MAAAQWLLCAERQARASSQMWSLTLELHLFLIGIVLTIVEAVVMVTRGWAFVVIMRSFRVPRLHCWEREFFHVTTTPTHLTTSLREYFQI